MLASTAVYRHVHTYSEAVHPNVYSHLRGLHVSPFAKFALVSEFCDHNFSTD